MVFEAAESLDNSDLQARAAKMSRQKAYDQLPLEEFEAADKSGWFSDSVPPNGSRADVEKPNLEVIEGGGKTKDITEGLEDAKKAEYPEWMQKELARMDGDINGNMMEVDVDNINVMQHVLSQRDDITRVLETNEEVINRLVTEDIRTKIENLVKEIHAAKYGKGREISAKKLKRETDKRMYGEKLSNRISNRIRGPMYPGYARELNSLSAIKTRITTLEGMLSPHSRRPTLPNRNVLEAELRELKTLRKAWHESEENIRTELSLVKNTKDTYLNETWGFINPEFRTNPDGSQTSSLEDWFSTQTMQGLPITPAEQNLFRKILRDGHLKKLILKGDTVTGSGDFYDWINSSPYSVPERNMIKTFWDSPEFQTYRELASVTNNDDLRNWDKTEDGKLMLSFLSNQQNHTYLHGGITTPPGHDNPIEVVGILQEMKGDEAIENIDVALKKAESKRNKLKLKIDGVPTVTPPVPGLKEKLENSKSIMEIEKKKLERYQNHLEVVKNRKARELQEEWIKLNQKEKDLGSDIRSIKKELSGMGGTSAIEANARAKTRDLLLKRQEELNDAKSKKETKQDEMSRFYEDSHPTGIAHSGTNFNIFEDNFRTDIFGTTTGTTITGVYGNQNPAMAVVSGKLSDVQAKFGDVERKHNAIKIEFDKVNTAFIEADAKVHTLKLNQSTLSIPGARNENITKRESVANIYTRLRAKSREAAMAAELGKKSTADLSATEKEQCLSEATGMIDEQKKTLKSADKGKRVEGVLNDYLSQRPNLSRSFSQFVSNAPRNTWDWLQKPVGETWGGKKLAQGKELAGTGVKKTVTGGKILGGFANRIFRSVQPS
ncbi:hypothetical protein K9N08_02125 [Candidatus Gracilibacteria bacterium]|nr:hypothetical protein [Candidatus Gracilibacteria bacterium]MCF7856334.1 hypothetical protein [Candidatus Gracilibacteria bacterium]MCF7896723.1 hypothetical protein [Candidatus Gracilibacteria bacterium]